MPTSNTAKQESIFMTGETTNPISKDVNVVINKWIVEASSEYNDGYTREYYRIMLKDIQTRLNELEFLKKD